MSDAKPARSLRSLVIAGFAWSLGTSVFLQVARVAFAVALARFLTPHEYGLATMALVFSALVFAFSDLSLGVGLVQRPEITEADRSTVFWTSAGVGFVMAGVGVALSGWIASFYGEPEVRTFFIVLSASFAVGSLGTTHAALLHRAMNFRSISLRVAASTIVGGVIGVALAAAGFGAWALIVQQLCIAVVSTALLWLSLPWRPQFVYSVASLRDLGAFGLRIFGVRGLDYLRINGDKLLVGRVLGSASLGTYSVAFNIVLMPLGRLLGALTDTLFPAFSRLQHDREHLASAWLRVTRLIAALFVPALAGLAVMAPEFVRVLLGERWADVALLLQIFVAGVVAMIVTALGVQVLTALDRASTLLRFSLAESAAVLVGVVVGLEWGVVGVAAAFSAVTVVARTYFAWLTAHVLGVPVIRLLMSVGGVAQATVVLLGATLLVKAALVGAGAPDWATLLLVTLAGVSVYVPVCLWRVPDIRAELARVWKDRRVAPSVGVSS